MSTKLKMADDKKAVKNTEEDTEETLKDDEKVNDAVVDGKKKTKTKPKPKVEEEEDESSEEEEEHPGLFDKPVLIEGKRERKKTEFLVKDASEIKKPSPLQFNGKGDALGTMEVVTHELSRCTAFELKPLHKLLFGREGKEKEIKRNIKLFNGFNEMEKGSKDYENKKFGLERFTMEGLKRLLEIFDLEKKGTREDYKERIFEFLLEPKETGRSLKTLQKKTKKKEKKKAAGKGEKRKRTPAKKATKSKEEVDDDSEEEEEGDQESDDEEEQPKKKKAKTVTPSKAKSTPTKTKKTPSKSKKDDKKDAKSKKKSKPVTVKITGGKRTPKKSPVKAKKPAEDVDSSDDEPLSKKAKKQQPTNEELAKSVKDLLKDADLDQVTVKSISKEVFAKYPEFDLSEKKSFIKETVYSVIAGEKE